MQKRQIFKTLRAWLYSVEPNQWKMVNSMTYSLGKTGSCWCLDKIAHSLRLTSAEDRSKLILSVSGIVWSGAVETPLTDINPLLTLRAEEFDFAKLTAMSTIVPKRHKNRITPHKTLCKLTIQWKWRVIRSYKSSFKHCLQVIVESFRSARYIWVQHNNVGM